MQKSGVFPNINNEKSVKEIKKTTPFKIASKIIIKNKFNQGSKRLVHQLPNVAIRT